jgi:glutathione S-transferase
MPTLHGIGISPFVRKVIVALGEKGIQYEHIPVVPFGQTPEYFAISPLGKVPCYEDRGAAIPDSSVIIDYLERVHPTPPLYPTDPIERAQALFLEEYADTKLVEVLLTVFRERFINVKFFKKECDEAAVKEALEVKIPPVLDYLEAQIGDKPFLIGGHFSIADIAVSSPFVNFAMGGETVDADRWPQLADFVQRMHARPVYKAAIEAEAP